MRGALPADGSEDQPDGKKCQNTDEKQSGCNSRKAEVCSWSASAAAISATHCISNSKAKTSEPVKDEQGSGCELGSSKPDDTAKAEKRMHGQEVRKGRFRRPYKYDLYSRCP